MPEFLLQSWKNAYVQIWKLKIFLKHQIAEFETEKEEVGKFSFFIQPALLLLSPWGFLLFSPVTHHLQQKEFLLSI